MRGTLPSFVQEGCIPEICQFQSEVDAILAPSICTKRTVHQYIIVLRQKTQGLSLCCLNCRAHKLLLFPDTFRVTQLLANTTKPKRSKAQDKTVIATVVLHTDSVLEVLPRLPAKDPQSNEADASEHGSLG
mmetsp:Transcript_98743/g.175779  ORF Transcript_98743/g.175779 Transcript_98743/m.175779 type:complete len:131 (-) Transcript_98743:530-922(-)